MSRSIVKSGVVAAVLAGMTLMFAGPVFAATPTTDSVTATAPVTQAAHPAAASVSTGRVDPAALAQGFATLNLTDFTMTEVSHSIQGQFNGQEPYDGTLTAQGAESTWGIVNWPDDQNIAEITYQLDDSAHTRFTVESDVEDEQINIDQSKTDLGFAQHYSAYMITRNDGSLWLSIQAKNAETHTLTGAQAQQQYETLKTFGNGGDVKYAFTPTGYTPNVLSAPTIAGNIVRNVNDPLPMGGNYTASDSVSTTSTWSASATLGVDIAGLVQAEASASYGQSYARDHTVTVSESLSVAEGYAGWMTAQYPVDRVTGNFTITIGNDTWDLQGVSFDIPLTGSQDGPVFNGHVLPLGDPNIPLVAQH